MPERLSLCYLPSAAWFAALLANPQIEIHAGLPFQKQTALSRTAIKGANKVELLSVQVEKETRRLPLTEVLLCDRDRWRDVHIRSLRSAYGRTAFFEHYAEPIFNAIAEPENSLFSFNLKLIKILLKMLKAPTVLNLITETPAAYFTPEEMRFTSAFTESWYSQKPYYQPFGNFSGGLSVVDLLMNCGPESTDILQQSLIVRP